MCVPSLHTTVPAILEGSELFIVISRVRELTVSVAGSVGGNVPVIPVGVNRPGLAKTMSEGVLSSVHPGGAMAANLDGSVQFIPESIDPEVLRQLISPSGLAMGRE